MIDFVTSKGRVQPKMGLGRVTRSRLRKTWGQTKEDGISAGLYSLRVLVMYLMTGKAHSLTSQNEAMIIQLEERLSINCPTG